MRRLSYRIALICILFGAAETLSAAILSVDADPGTAGIQSTVTVNPMTTFDVDIVISDVVGLGGFELDLDFAPLVLGATSVVDGGFLAPPILVLESDLSPPDVNLTAITLGPGTATGSGVLATISFDALSIGVSDLDLNDVILAASGVLIPVAEVNDGNVRVAAAAAPEPSVLVLIAIGLAGVAAARRRSLAV